MIYLEEDLEIARKAVKSLNDEERPDFTLLGHYCRIMLKGSLPKQIANFIPLPNGDYGFVYRVMIYEVGREKDDTYRAQVIPVYGLKPENLIDAVRDFIIESTMTE